MVYQIFPCKGYAQEITRLDTSFNPSDKGLHYEFIKPFSIAVTADDHLLALGVAYGDTGLFRLNNDGSIDSAFVSEIAPTDQLGQIFLQEDGKILLTGLYNNQFALMRLLPDGNLDNGFSHLAFADTTHRISKVSLLEDGQIVIAGNFILNNCKNIARLNSDGSQDTIFKAKENNLSNIMSLVVMQDKSIFLSALGDYDGKTIDGIFRIFPDGSLNENFDTSDWPFETTYQRMSIALSPEQKIIVYGFFRVAEIWDNYLFQINENGSLDTTFAGGKCTDGSIKNVCVMDNKIYAIGNFTKYNGVPVFSIIRLNPDGTRDFSFYAHLNYRSFVNSIAINKNIYLQVNLYPMVSIKKINKNGKVDDLFRTLRGFGFDNTVAAFHNGPEGKTYVGGNFRHYNYVPVSAFARLNKDGSLDSTFNTGTGFDGSISTIAVQPDEKILLSGPFWNFDNEPTKDVIRLNPDGSRDFSFSPDFTGNATAFAVQENRRIIAGGYFTSGSMDYFLIRLFPNGRIDKTFDASHVRHVPNCIKILEDGKILISGNIRLNTDGSIDESYESPKIIYSNKKFGILQDGKILVLGYDGKMVKIHKDGSVDPGFAFDENIQIHDFDLLHSGKIIAVGSVENQTIIIRISTSGKIEAHYFISEKLQTHHLGILAQTDGNIMVKGYFRETIKKNFIFRLIGDPVPLEIAGIKKEGLGPLFFPNPNMGSFFVSDNFGFPVKLQVYNFLSDIIYEGDILTSSEKIELPVPSPGIYLLRIRDSAGIVKSGKLVIRK